MVRIKIINYLLIIICTLLNLAYL